MGREIPKRTTPAGVTADPVVAWRAGRLRQTKSRHWPERVPWPAAPIALQRTGGTPLMDARDGIPYAHRAQPDQIFPARISFPAERVKYPHPRNGPFRFKRRVPGRKFVIALPVLAKSGVASHRHRDQQRPGRGCAGCRCRRGGGRGGISHPRYVRSGGGCLSRLIQPIPSRSMASQYKSGHGSSSRVTPPLETGAPMRMARIVSMISVRRFSGACQPLHLERGPTVYHHGRRERPAIGQACASMPGCSRPRLSIQPDSPIPPGAPVISSAARPLEETIFTDWSF